MTREGARHAVGDSEDFGLSGHLASIERMHSEALAQLEALAQPWGDLWSPSHGGGLIPTEKLPLRAERARHGAHAAAA